MSLSHPAWAGAQRACLNRENWRDCMKGLLTKHDQDSRKPSPVQYVRAGRSEEQQTPLGLKGPRQWLETGQGNYKERALWWEPALDRQIQPTHSEKAGGKQGMNAVTSLSLCPFIFCYCLKKIREIEEKTREPLIYDIYGPTSLGMEQGGEGWSKDEGKRGF